MKNYNSIEDYLEGHRESFAYPILVELYREIMTTLPHVEQTVKWGKPSFEHKGLMLGMVAFKEVVTLWFHRGAELNDPSRALQSSSDETKFMRKLEYGSVDEIDRSILRALLIEAWEVNDRGEQVKPLRKAKPRQESALLSEALAADNQAAGNFDLLPPYKQREFAEFIETAKKEETRQRRLEKSLILLREGRGLNDKYRSK